MAKAPRIATIVSHTHWDREWYLTFSEFRVMLERTVSGILDQLETEEAYRHFCLDGQAVVLEDYLAVRPEDEERIRRLAAAGALSLGPFYVLPDEILIPPEATVRNLLLGHAVASRYGPVQTVGYLPDPFGHPAQLPQILARAGIDAFVYTRGNGDEIDTLGLEYMWAAPDGSEVLAIHQLDGYCNAAALGHEELWHAHTPRAVDPARAVAKVGALFDKMATRSHTSVWLLNNGCDHHPAQRDFTAVLGALEAAFPDTEFRHASYPAFVEALREGLPPLETFQGELLGGKLHHVLSGVWSTRMPLKQLNERAETTLAGTCEPLLAYAHFLHGRSWPRGLLETTWKLLLQNQPHDSICGCSTDSVHREMLPRFASVLETSEQMMRDALQDLAPTFGTTPEADGGTVLAVFNPLPLRRQAVVERLVVLQPEYAAAGDAYELLDEDGETVPFEVVGRELVERFWGVDYRMMLGADAQDARFAAYCEAFGDRILRPDEEKDTADTFLRIRFLADLPPCGHALFSLRARPAGTEAEDLPEAVRVEGSILDNGLVRVELHQDGTLDLLDHRTGCRYPGLAVLRDVADVGDEYDFSPVPGDVAIVSSGTAGTAAVVDGGGLAGALQASFVLEVPARLAEGRQGRSAACVACAALVTVRLEVGSPLVDLTMQFENRAEDHRLRVAFPLAIEAEEVVSDGHFLLDRRPIEPPAGEGWVQPHPGTYPQQGFVAVESPAGGLAVLNRGLPEFQTHRREDGGVDLEVTLLRSVGWLSRDDFASRRRQNAGPTVPTPEAQCLGEQRFRLALVPFAGDLLTSGIADWSRAWRLAPVAVQGVEESAPAGGLGLLEKSSPHVQVTAVKRHEGRGSLVVRLVNLAGEPTVERLGFGVDIAHAWTTTLLEERERELRPTSQSSLDVFLGPHEIVTLEIEVQGG